MIRVGLILLVVTIALLSLAAGRSWLMPAQLLEILAAGPGSDILLWELRLPRVLCGLLVGAGLGVSGALFQSLLRNPLASPDIIGVTQGAAFGAVASLVAGTPVLLGAWTGGLVAMGMIFGLSLSWRFGLDPMRLVLNGVGIGITAVAGTTILITQVPEGTAGQAMLWLSGSLNALGWPDVAIAAGLAGPLGLTLLALQRRLALIELGDDLARSLGVDLRRWRPAIALCSAVLAAGLVAVTGPLGFVALCAGPIARGLGQGGPNLAGAALIGACLVMIADMATRVFAPSALLPAGLYTALIGAPVLIFVVFRQFRRAEF